MSTISDETILSKLRTDGLDTVALSSLLSCIVENHPCAHLIKAHFVPSMIALDALLCRRAGAPIIVQKLGIMAYKDKPHFIYWFINTFDRHFVPGSDGKTLIETYVTVTTSEVFYLDYVITKKNCSE